MSGTIGSRLTGERKVTEREIESGIELRMYRINRKRDVQRDVLYLMRLNNFQTMCNAKYTACISFENKPNPHRMMLYMSCRSCESPEDMRIVEKR